MLLDIRANFVGLMTDARCDADGGLFAFHLLQETDPWMNCRLSGQEMTSFIQFPNAFLWELWELLKMKIYGEVCVMIPHIMMCTIRIDV